MFLFLLGKPAEAQVLKYSTGLWNSDALGNHRTVIQVKSQIRCFIGSYRWHRCDHHPENIDVIVVDAKIGKRINNVYRVDINREFCELIFQTATRLPKIV